MEIRFTAIEPPRTTFLQNGGVVTTSLTNRVIIIARGETPEEMRADALRQAAERNATNLMASGIDNYRADWEAAFGPVVEPEGSTERSQFLDDEIARERRDYDTWISEWTWWQRAWFWLMEGSTPEKKFPRP